MAISIYYSPVTIHPKTANNGDESASPVLAPNENSKKYESFLIAYYEGSKRVVNRRNSLVEARKYAKEIASRLSHDAARAEFLTDLDRRIYTLAQVAVKPLGMDVDEVCRRYAELQRRLKEGSLKEAVDFKNTHALRVRLFGLTPRPRKFSSFIWATSKSAGVGDYHLRDIKRYVGNFVEVQPGLINRIQTHEIDSFLAAHGGKARNKNNHRDAIIAFFSFAQKKGFLPRSLPHAAEDTTEFRTSKATSHLKGG